VVDRLIEEFRVELAALGVKLPGSTPRPPGALTFVPVDRAQVTLGAASRDLSFVNSQGFRFQHGLNGGATFESRLQVGDVFSVYVQPELTGNEEYGAARLASGYVKLTLFNVELAVGRESLWWGPGRHGSVILSNNAPPLDHVRLGSAEPFLLPWIGEWIGPTKILAFLAELEERRDHPRAKLAGMRATITPFSWLELGASRTIMFNGDDRPRLSVRQYPEVIFRPDAGDDRADAKFRNNSLFAIDADVRIAGLDQYFLPMRDLRLYGEFGWDDTCCESNFIPLRDAISTLVGIHSLGVLGVEGLEANVEYTRSSRLSFRHTQFTSGYWTRGEVLSHYVGTDGEDYWGRLAYRVTDDLMLGVQGNRATLGRTSVRPSVKERRLGVGVDVSYRFRERYAVFGQYLVSDVENRNFRAGDDGIDHLFRVEITRSFR
jgi:hypothetical protein